MLKTTNQKIFKFACSTDGATRSFISRSFLQKRNLQKRNASPRLQNPILYFFFLKKKKSRVFFYKNRNLGFGRSAQLLRAINQYPSPDNENSQDFNANRKLPGFWFARPSDSLIKAYFLRMLQRRFLKDVNNLLEKLLGKNY
jgi:hypothetical protein